MLRRMKYGPVYPLVTIKIDARGVGNPAQLAAREVHDIFAIAYPAVGDADLGNVAPLADQTVHMQMEVLGRSPDDERASVMRRLMAMCISDLSRGIRQTLEHASAHAELVRARPEMFRSDDDFGSEDERADAIVAAVERFKTEALSKAQSMRYPQLLAKVQKDLSAPLHWAPELTSFQKVRNCLEHRSGIVGSQDVDEAGTLVLSLPYLEAGIIERDGLRRPMRLGMPLKNASAMHFQVAVRQHTFKLGEPIVVEPKQIAEIAFAVWLFASDIVDKLSTRPERSSRVEMHI
jgi:hypothetical protein